jgi:hypothetical protein
MKKAAQLILAGIVVLITSSLCLAGSHHAGEKGYKKGGHMVGKSFLDIDTDKDGLLSFKEYQTAFPSQQKKGFDFLDTSKDGQLDKKEWQAFEEMHKGMGSHHKKKYHHADLPDPAGFNAHFGDMDANNDDRVSLDEFNAFFPGEKKTDKVFAAIDTDKSNTLDHDEWHDFKDAHGLRHIEE